MLIIDNRTSRKPMGSIWEQAGANVDSMSAREALNLFPDLDPEMRALYYPDGLGSFNRTSYRGIFMPGQNEPVAVVKGRYHQITPRQFVQLWDDCIGMPVVAMGAAGNMGENFYLAGDLMDLEIKGDPVKMYLMGTAPQANRSAAVRITPVRMFCTNQMHASKRRALINANVPHNNMVEENLADWLKHLTTTVAERLKLVEHDFNTMIEAAATQQRIHAFVEKVYAFPNERDFEGMPESVRGRRVKEFNTQVSMIEGRRRDFTRFYEGAMTGADNLDSTMYRAYNAAVELAQYRKGITNEGNRAVSALLGKRAEEIETIYDVALEVSRAF